MKKLLPKYHKQSNNKTEWGKGAVESCTLSFFLWKTLQCRKKCLQIIDL